MARPLAPHGTEAAYRRHLREKSEPCRECRDAASASKAARLDGDRSVRSLKALAPVSDLHVAEPDVFDPLADAKENLVLVKSALAEAVPREVAALSKRRQELVSLIAELGGKKEVSLADQLAELRGRRSGT